MALPAAVVFDLDGTLTETEKHCARARDDLAEYLGGGLVMPTAEEAVGVADADIVRSVLSQRGSAPDEADVLAALEWLTWRTGELFKAGVPLRPGAIELLDHVHASGVPIALVTSTVRYLTEIALSEIGAHYFSVVVCGDDGALDNRTKPYPEPFLLAAERLGVDPASCVAVEDSTKGAASVLGAGFGGLLVVPCDVAFPVVVRTSLTGVDIRVLSSMLK